MQLPDLYLTEPDINRTQLRLYPQQAKPRVECIGQTAIIEPLQMEIHLPCDGKMISADTLHDEIGKTKQIGFTAVMLAKTAEQPR